MLDTNFTSFEANKPFHLVMRDIILYITLKTWNFFVVSLMHFD